MPLFSRHTWRSRIVVTTQFVHSSKSKSSSDTGQSEPTEVPIPVEHVRVEEPEPAETESRDNDEAPPTDEGASLDAAVADSGMYMSEEDSDRNKEGACLQFLLLFCV